MKIVIEILIAGAFLVLLYLAARFIQRKYFSEVVHPYTGKPDEEIIYISMRILMSAVGVLAMLWSSPIGSVLSLGLGFIFYWQLINYRKKKETVIIEIAYTKEDQEEWDVNFKKIKKNMKQKTKVTSRVVITSEYIYLSKHKKISFVKKTIDNIRFESAEYKNGFLHLKYMYAGLPIQDWYVYIPARDQKNIQKLLKNKI